MDPFEAFVGKIGVMKPSSVKEDNANEVAKLQAIFNSQEYVAENKVDGCHYFSVGNRFFSTEGIEKTNNYPHLNEFIKSLGFPNIILDGEANYPGKTSQYCTRVTGASPEVAIDFQNENGMIHYTIWDMLRTPRGTWLINQPWYERRKLLEEFYERFIVGTSMEQYIHLTEVVTENKKQYYDNIIAEGGEGCVLKKINSIYLMGKKPKWEWVKAKQKDEADFFISGYEAPKAKYSGKQLEDWPYWAEINGIYSPVTKYYYNNWIGALELSAFVKGRPEVICRCSGMNDELRQKFSESPDTYLNKVVKISFMEKTEAGYPRHPRFEMFHESKTPKECTWELGGN